MTYASAHNGARRARRALLPGVLALFCLAPVATAAPAATAPAAAAAASAGGATAVLLPKSGLSATLAQCVTTGPQAERSATFAGEMATIAGSARMEMRIEVTERRLGELTYHTVTAPGLGVWRSSAPGVKAYRYLKQVTNLAGPAFYRGVVRYRWLSAKGRLLASSVLRTKRCEQPETEEPEVPTTALPKTPSALSES